MYTRLALIKALDILYPEHSKGDLMLPAAIKEAAVNAFINHVENAHTKIIREALEDMFTIGCFRFTSEEAFLQSVPEGVWVPASGGTETAFTSRSGKRLLYCYNRSIHKHAYLDIDNDIILTDKEAAEALETGA